MVKSCLGMCDYCVWLFNGGCSEWNGYSGDTEVKYEPIFNMKKED